DPGRPWLVLPAVEGASDKMPYCCSSSSQQVRNQVVRRDSASLPPGRVHRPGLQGEDAEPRPVDAPDGSPAGQAAELFQADALAPVLDPLPAVAADGG
ncbi:hypothetical protein, partial [Streptomyces albidoflavus]|uniref:hypothetical protein n=1 Tax=Streptomyces albidoflavus TaxID=1886 RepID=UPI00211BCF26